MNNARKMAMCGAAILTAAFVVASDDDLHAASPYILSAISAGLPKYVPAKAASEPAAGPADGAARPMGTPAGVLALPAFTVTESKLPRTEKITTYKGMTSVLVNKYLGPRDGIDRGILNRLTLVQLWQKIPILGRLPFAGTPVQMSLEERGLDDAGANNPLRTKPIE
jgi:hypothetical protein